MRKALLSVCTAAGLAALALQPAAAQVTFAHFEESNNNEFHYFAGTQALFDELYAGPGPIDVDFVFKAGAGALDGHHIDASLAFYTTVSLGVAKTGGGPADPTAGVSNTETFNQVYYTFVSKQNIGAVHVGDTLLKVATVGINSLDGVNGATQASLHGDTMNGDAITYTSAFDSLAAASSSNGYNMELTSVTPAIGLQPAAVGGGWQFKPFIASDGGSFSAAPVPELSTMLPFAGMVVGGGLLASRRRRAA